MGDSKISTLPAGAPLGGGETVPAVQAGATVRLTPDQIAAYGNRQVRPIAPIMSFHGNSIGEQNALQWGNSASWHLRARHGFDLIVDPRPMSAGGYNTAVGGTGASHLVNTQMPMMAAALAGGMTRPDIGYVGGGARNDFAVASPPAVPGVWADYKTFIDYLIDIAGVPLVLAETILPNKQNMATALMATGLRRTQQFNSLLKQYCRQRRGRLVCVDVAEIMIDRAASSYQPLGGMTVDHVHLGHLTARAIADQIAPLIGPMTRRIAMRSTDKDNLYDATDNRLGNLLGSSGLFTDTANGSFLGGASALVWGGWAITTNKADGLTITPARRTGSGGYGYDRLNGGLYNEQEIAIAGTASNAGAVAGAPGNITLNYTRFSAGGLTDAAGTRLDAGGVAMMAEIFARSLAPAGNLPIPRMRLFVEAVSPGYVADVVQEAGFTTSANPAWTNQGMVFPAGRDEGYVLRTCRPAISPVNTAQFQLQIDMPVYLGTAYDGVIRFANPGLYFDSQLG